jgi:cephalosporin-C deacetylase-like acetyl esterase
MLHDHYPAPAEVDAWCDSLLANARARQVTVSVPEVQQYQYQLNVPHSTGNHYVEFTTPERTFYGYWQPATTSRAPVLFHVPGYGAEMSAHPTLVTEGFNVLHINPLGYCTPTGTSNPDMGWSVMPDSVTSKGEAGYVDWFSDAIVAVEWALSQACVDETRIGFFGTSQGGGTALILGSLFAGTTSAVCGDVPYLTNYPLMATQNDKGAYNACLSVMTGGGTPDEWRALGFIDTLSHAHRMNHPVLLTAGSEDGVTPPVTIESLFDILPGTRSYTYLHQQGHGYTTPFLRLASAWFNLYV